MAKRKPIRKTGGRGASAKRTTRKAPPKRFEPIVSADCPASTPPAVQTGLPLSDWARRFLGEYFTDEPGAFHTELMRDLERADLRLLVRVAPRGHAKSTCASLALPLWLICERRGRNVVIVSHEAGLATQFVRDIRGELEANEAIIEQYGDLTQAPANTDESRGAADQTAAPPRRRSRAKWAESVFTAANGVTVRAKGAGAALRGIRVGPNRPDLIICDDIEKDERVRSPVARKRLEHWLRRVVMPALTPRGRLIVVGSLLHFDSLLANLCNPRRFPRWDCRVYRALEAEPVEEGASSASDTQQFRMRALWPARWPVERLEEERARIGTTAFEQEYQGNPVDDDHRVFQPEWLRRCTHAEIDALSRASRFTPLIAVDPATGVDGGDFFAMWIGGVDTNSGRILTRELDLSHIGFVAQVERITAAFVRCGAVKVGVESVGYQEALCQALEEHGRKTGVYIPVERIATRQGKPGRIVASACFYENGTFFLPENLSPEVEAQFLHFPSGRNDDAPDVCAMAIQLARSVRAGIGAEPLVSRVARASDRRGGW